MNKQSFSGRHNVTGHDASALGAAVIGAGLMGYWHAQAVARAGGRVLAVIDREQMAAQRLADQLPQARAYPSLEAAAAAQTLSVLHVCTPTPTHVALVKAGLERGLHVLVEKPLAPNARQMAQLFDLAAAQGLALCPVHQFVFQEGVQAAHGRLSSLGSLVRLHVEIRSAGGIGADENTQNQLVADILPHCLSLAQYLLPHGVENIRWRAVRPMPGELCVLGSAGATAGAATGAAAIVFDLSLHGRPPINRCTLVCERGSLLLNLFHGYAVYEPGTVSKMRKVAQPFASSSSELAAAAVNLGRRSVRRQSAYPGLWELVRQFYAALAERTAAPISPASALATACARDAILESLEESGL